MTAKQQIGFIGLGKMGQPMASNLLKAGYELRVYNRTPEKAAELVKQGARVAKRPADAVDADGIVVTMVANDQALQEVTLGDGGIEEKLADNGIHISMSTVAPATSSRLAALHVQHGAGFVAAPVFGRPDAAAAKKLWICASGSASARDRARPVLQAMGQAIFDFGEEPGAANVVKLAGNFLIVAAMEAMAEAFALAEKNDIDRAAMANLLGQTLFACPIYQNYGNLIAAHRYEPAGFKLALGLKDINLVAETATESRVPMPFASILRDRLIAGLAKDRGELDWAAVALAATEDAGLSA